MNRKVLVPLAAAGVAVLLSWAAGPAPGQPAAKKKRDQLNRYVQQMQAKFRAWDLNQDSMLDKAELAKAFRGPNAKPFDADADDGTKKVDPVATVLVTVPVPTPPVSYAVAEVVASNSPKSAPAVDYTTFPDYQFLVLVAKNGQTQVIRQDFDAWARQYAQNVQQMQYAQSAAQQAQTKVQQAGQAAQEAQTKLQQAKGKATVQRAQKALQKATQKLNQAQASFQQRSQDYTQAAALVNAVPPAIRQQFPLNR